MMPNFGGNGSYIALDPMRVVDVMGRIAKFA